MICKECVDRNNCKFLDTARLLDPYTEKVYCHGYSKDIMVSPSLVLTMDEELDNIVTPI